MRVCLISRVRPDRLEEYKRRHAAVWPEMLEALRDSGWRDYSLYLSPDGLLVGHLQTEDYDAARAAMAATEVNARWQAEMEQFFVSDGSPDRGFTVLEEVFSLEDQLRANGLPVRPQPMTTEGAQS
jgi:L-rhamnose mutarotase